MRNDKVFRGGMRSIKDSSPITWRSVFVVVLALVGAAIIVTRGDFFSWTTLATVLASIGLARLVTLKPLGSHQAWALASALVGVALFFSHVGDKIDVVSDATFAFDTISTLDTTPGLRVGGEPVESSNYMNAALRTCSPDRVAHLGMLDLVHEATQVVYLSGTTGDVNQLVGDIHDVTAVKKRDECAQVLGELAVRHQWVKAVVQAERTRLEKLTDITVRH